MNKSRIALIGAGGMLAAMVSKIASDTHQICPLDLPDFDVTDRDRVLRTIARIQPEIVLNCSAFTNVDGCEAQEELATAVNGRGPGYLAEAARETGAVLVHVSTDYVFDGKKQEPYREEDQTNPVSAYGRSKLAGERAVLESGLERYFIVRTSWLYGPGGKNFVETIIRLASEREELRIVADQVGTPTYTEDLARAVFKLLALKTSQSSSIYGIYHISNEGICSWHGFAEAIVKEMRHRGTPVSAGRVLPIRTEDYPLPAARPAYSVFSKDKYRRATGASLPDWRSSLSSYFAIR